MRTTTTLIAATVLAALALGLPSAGAQAQSAGAQVQNPRAPADPADPADPAEPVLTDVNPFAGNRGFTLLSLGDVGLNNLEFEGSVAAFGAASTVRISGPLSPNIDGYPIVHHSAGSPDYSVPLIDGEPVRLLADRFEGAPGSTISITPEDVSGTLDPASPEALASAKLVRTSGLRGEAVADPYGEASVDPFLRLHSAESAMLNLKATDARAATVADIATEQDTIGAYFPGLAEETAAVEACLAGLYALDADAVTELTVTSRGPGSVTVSGAVTDRVNVLNYEDVRGSEVRFDAAGWEPSVRAPLVIRVPAGTTHYQDVTFAGWQAHTGPQQALARNILVDMAAVDSRESGPVTIRNAPFGSVWAPNVDVIAQIDDSALGQWYVGSVDLSQSGEFHHQSFTGSLPCAASSAPWVQPRLETLVRVGGTTTKVLPVAGGDVVDTVTYSGLTPGVEYALRGSIRTAPAGASIGVEATVSFTPAAASGSVDVPFRIERPIAAAHAGRSLVVFEELFAGDLAIASHVDPLDEDQTFAVASVPTVPPVSGEESADLSNAAPSPRAAPKAGLAATGADGRWLWAIGVAVLGAGLAVAGLAVAGRKPRG